MLGWRGAGGKEGAGSGTGVGHVEWSGHSEAATLLAIVSSDTSAVCTRFERRIYRLESFVGQYECAAPAQQTRALAEMGPRGRLWSLCQCIPAMMKA